MAADMLDAAELKLRVKPPQLISCRAVVAESGRSLEDCERIELLNCFS
jgi:hypothetical protein